MDQARRVRMAGTVYAVGGALWFVVATVVAARFGGAPPPGSGALVLSEVFWLVVGLLLLVGFFGLYWSGAVGRSRFGVVAFGIAVLGHALFLAGGLANGATSDVLLAAAALLSALGLVLVGIATIVARRWQGWTRIVPLLAGLYFFVAMFPFYLASADPSPYAVGGWGLLRLALGLAIRGQGQAQGRPAVAGTLG